MAQSMRTLSKQEQERDACTYVDLWEDAVDALDLEQVREVAHDLVHEHARAAL